MTRRQIGWLVAAWTAAFVVESLRLPLLGTFVDLDVLLRGSMWLCLLAWTIYRVRRFRRWWPRVAAPLAGLLLVALCFNWSVIAPRLWFETHRVFYDATVPDGYDGTQLLRDRRLALPLGWLSAMGHVESTCTVCDGSDASAPYALFFAQWYGIPDDAGGYIYSPGGSPHGANMDGMLCDDPVDLGDGWWMCGM